ncbi:hypothetical protein PV328_008206 [Microctonus aethiopoides]|uniref:CAP-Gly domain-containing protein n=1 Tax=Microctonus aethiopoides TaxID=144406 RepID=A0AA39CAC4_9HYME|nr:hypothetical protein PV328_008206 [Microctonus aethiopoides]
MSEKTSGLRQPSKIGRPCCASNPKPAIPPSSPRSSSSMNSMEPIYENPIRKTSTSGPRRESDTSVVLTEDTDSFIIGDRIWVGGTKPGSIAFIGETKFAPGEWAGVVLDEPIGKNDGSVAGTRYFQCAAKHGIFSRLTRLTRYPLSDTSLLSPNEMKSPMSPEGRLSKSISPSLNTSTTSLSSMVSHRDLKLGDRVIVSSSQGSKTGVLRYIGETEFATGEWCGVELDDPVGKNDGSVADKRYFECRPKHGLFAPVHKVSRSPSNKRPSMCMVHKSLGTGLNSTMRRMGSRESVTSVSSMASTTASTATRGPTSSARKSSLRTSPPVRSTLQEMLKEKQQEIEMLKRERDLERERITKAANQADHAEQTKALLKKEYDKYREDMEKMIKEKQEAFAILLEEKNQLNGQLEEERQKCEDLLFRVEEASVNKEDIQKNSTEQNVMNVLNETKIKELESQLTEERERVIQLEHNNTKLFEVEEELEKIRSEKIEYLELQNRNLCLEEAKITLEKEVLEQNELIKQYLDQIKNQEVKINTWEKENVTAKDHEVDLQKNYDDIKKSLEEKSQLVDKLTKEYTTSNEILMQEIEKLKEVINKINEQNVQEKQMIMIENQKIIAEKDHLIQLKTKELEEETVRHINAEKIALEQLTTDNASQIDQLSTKLKEQLNEKDREIASLTQKLQENSLKSDGLLNELTSHKSLAHDKDEELKMVRVQLQESNVKLESLEKNNEELKNEQTNEIEKIIVQNSDGMNLMVEERKKLEETLTSLQASVSTDSVQLEKLKENLKAKETELIELQKLKATEIDELTRKLEEKTQYTAEINEDMTQKSIKLSNLEQEVENLKLQLNTKDEEINPLLEKTSELKDALTLSEQTKTNLESELRMYDVKIAESNKKMSHAEEKIAQLIEQKNKLETEIANVISSSANSSDQLIKYNEELRLKEKELDEFRERTCQLENLMTSSEAKMNRAEEELKAASQSIERLKCETEELKDQLEVQGQSKEQLLSELNSLKVKEQELTEIVKSKENLKEELDSKLQIIAELTSKLKSAEENVSALDEKYSSLSSSNEIQTQVLQRHTEELEQKIIASREEINNLQDNQKKLLSEKIAIEKSMETLNSKFNDTMESKVKLEVVLLERENELKSLRSKIEEVEKEKENVFEITSNETQIAKTEILKLNNCVSDLQKRLEESENKSQKNIEEYKAIVHEKDLECTRWQENSTKMEINIATLQQEIIECQEKLKLTSTEKSVLEEQLKSMELDLNSARNELKDKVKVIEDMMNEMETLKNTEQQSLNESKISFEMKMKDQKLALDNTMKELDTIKSEKQNFEATLQLLKSEVRKREEDIVNQQKEIMSLKKENEEIIAAQLERNNSLNTKQAEVDEILKQNKNLELAKVSLEKNNREAEEKIQYLSNSIKNNEEMNAKAMKSLLDELNMMKNQSVKWQDAESQLKEENKQLNTKLNTTLEELKTSMENRKNMTEINSQNQMIVMAAGDSKAMSNNDIEYRKLIEDSEMYKGQIDFLNSVIVDMQKKNEKLLCKIEVLEMGVPANEADDYNRVTLDNKAAAPRMFCDICDQFDLHETEDCPKQSQDFEVEKPVEKSPKKPMVERPYCENCEMFGHDTADCDDAETF